jgi:S1-C subfamily serine protease
MLRHSSRLTTSLLALALFAFPVTTGWSQDNLGKDAHQLTPAAAEQFCVDDRAVNLRLSQLGGQLIDTGKTTPIEDLVQQLSTKRCQLTLPKIDTRPMTTSELYKKVKDSVVIIGGLYKCNKCSKWHANGATGFVIASTGVVLTNHHVVNNKNKKTLVAMTASGDVLPVTKVLAANEDVDLAILQVEGKVPPPLPMALSPEAAPIGSRISVISHPAGQYYTYTGGMVSRYVKSRSKTGAMVDHVSITADYARGSSGGPVLNDRGEVIGIVKSTQPIFYRMTNGKGENLQMVVKLCIPSASILQLINQ